MATKKELATAVETLVEAMAVKYGAEIVTKRIKVGGKETDSRVAEGGAFDLDACRGILIKALKANVETLITFSPVAAKSSLAAAADGPRIGPDGKVHMGSAAANGN